MNAEFILENGEVLPIERIRQRLRSDILNALNLVYVRDAILLADGIDVCERCLMHRFTHYFILQIESICSALYQGIKVDGEYNRHGYNPKSVFKKAKKHNIIPDVVVHGRGHDDNNICVIEFKKKEKKRDPKELSDSEKLECLTVDDGGYRYLWGVHITFKPGGNVKDEMFRGVGFRWFRCGRHIRKLDENVLLPLCGRECSLRNGVDDCLVG